MPVRISEIDDPDVARHYFALDPDVHLYGLADLEDPIWSLSRWFALRRQGTVEAVAGIVGLPGGSQIFYAQGRGHDAELGFLCREVSSEIPHGCLATLAHGVEPELVGLVLEPEGEFQRMILRDASRARRADEGVALVGVEALPAMHRFIEREKNLNMFLGPAMFCDVDYRVVWDGPEIAAMAGVHVFSDTAEVAAIGNVLTARSRRRQGLAMRVVGDLTAELQSRVRLVGLNHRVANLAAQRCYEQLGFEPVHTYIEGRLVRPSDQA